MLHAARRFASHVTELVGSPIALMMGTGVCVIWAVVDRPFDWLDAVSAATFWMLFSLQCSQNADTRALHAKLDEIIKAEPGANNAVRGIEKEM